MSLSLVSLRGALSALSAPVVCITAAMVAVACTNEVDPAPTSPVTPAIAEELTITPAPPPLKEYALLAGRAIVVGERSVVVGGHLGVATEPGEMPGTLLVGSGARVGLGTAVLVDTVVLGPASITGGIAANHFVIGPQVTTGPRSPFVAPPAPPVPATVAGGSGALVVRSGYTQTIGPGSYGTITINGTLYLTGGVYQVHRVQMGDGGRLVALAPATMRIATGLSAGSGARLGPAAGLGAGDLRIVAAGMVDDANNSILLGVDGRLTALVIARHVFRAGNRLIATGAIAAKDIFLGPDTRFTFATGFACTSSASCAGGGTCQSAVCADAQCNLTAAPDGTACDDGSVCSRGDHCRAGVCAGTSIVTEYASGMTQPNRIVAGPDAHLWFISAESAPGAADGLVARLSPVTASITTFASNLRLLDIASGPDGNLWLAGRLSDDDLSADAAGLSTLARISPSGAFLEPLVGIFADRIAAGPDGNVWFVSEVAGQNITGAIRPADGLVTAILFVSNVGRQMTAGPDGNVSIAESNGGGGPAVIGRITPDSVLTEFPVATAGDLNAITLGPDGNLWFTDDGQNQIGRVTPDGVITGFPVPGAAGGLTGLTLGPDGNLWFTERTANRLGRITPAGQVTEFPCIPTAASGPTSIAASADGRLWFTETRAGNVASLDLP